MPDGVYLDHAASTPMRPEAVAAMAPFLADEFANPSGGHRAGCAPAAFERPAGNGWVRAGGGGGD